MKALPLFLVASLAANAAWFTTSLLRTPGSTTTLDPATGRSSSGQPTLSGSRPAAGATTTTSSTDRSLSAAFKSDDPEQLRDALRAAGVDDDIVRQLVGARIWKKYEARFKALQNNPSVNASTWWKNPDGSRYQGLTKEQREESRRLQKEIKEESERLLGATNTVNQNPWLERQYGFLPTDKRELLQQTEQDYNELIGEINQETQGFQLPSDREQLRFLEEEKRRDLVALLTPEELRAYDMRNSSTAQQLRWKMTKMDASEEEYVQIFDLQKNFDDQYNPSSNYQDVVERDQAYWKARKEAEKDLNAQIQATIGDQRYLDYVMSNDHGFQQVQAATLRLGLPEDTPRKIYSLRADIPDSANSIAADTNLSYEQKTAQLTQLATTARDQIRTQLGAEAAEVILKNNSFRWINELEKGNIITYDADGGQSSKRLQKPPAAKKP